ncbi:MAG: arginine--tRNA ligase [Acetobacter sp.]|nr:arginine--tRNA ligase [Acetobacter sp.]
MQTIIETLNEIFTESFKNAGYEADLGRVVVSARPDLCQFQVNGAMSGAKLYRKAPLMIANDVVANLPENNIVENVTVVAPGFINITVKDSFISQYLSEMATAENAGFTKTENPKTIVIDYGGPNVAKPLHVGHLRSAVIGEALKRMNRFAGNKVIADAHLGDFGLQMGLIIHELSCRQPSLPYFDESYTGEYPTEAPFSLKDLEEIYPFASGKSKEDEEYLTAARNATKELQSGRRGYRALWQHIMNVSLPDLKRNYRRLDVDFDLWNGESDSEPYIPNMVKMMKDKGFAYESEGALVVDVKEETDNAPIPPCIILKSDGSAIYETTDLATLVEREEKFQPDRVMYVVDKRQVLHFERVFRCAKKTGVTRAETDLSFIGFGTVNGKDGKPFKTRAGGTMKLSELLDTVESQVNIKDAETMTAEELKTLSQIIGLAAIKYGDLMNPSESNYIFDIDKFASFEGNTGPYILYTMVRIKSILSKLAEKKPEIFTLSSSVSSDTHSEAILKPAQSTPSTFTTFTTDSERELALTLIRFSHTLNEAIKKDAPAIICSYIYEIANKFNAFYHDKKILAETDETILRSLVALITLTYNVLEININLLGFTAPEKM